MHKPLLSLSFDDGRKDQYYNVMPLLEKYQIPATFNITTGYIEGRVKAAEKPAMSESELLEMIGCPLFEIAGHGDMHTNDLDDIALGRKKLLDYANLPHSTPIGFASPGSGIYLDYIEEHEDLLRNMGFSYIRTSLRIKSKYLLRTFSRKAARVIHSPMLYQIAYNDTVQKAVDGLAVVSIPVMFDITLNQLKRIVRFTEKQRGWTVIMFHSIEKPDSEYYHDTWNWDYDQFEQFLKFINEERNNGRLDITTTIDGYRIMREMDVKGIV